MSILKRSVFRIGRLLLMIYFGLMLSMAFFQRSLIYYPFQVGEERGREEAALLGWQEWSDAEDGFIGWQSQQAAGDGTLVIFHGNAGNAFLRRYWVDIISRLPQEAQFAHYHVLEYPGYGFREGKPSEKTFLAAAKVAMASLRDAPRPIILLGESLGGGVATVMAAEYGDDLVDGLLLVTPFDRLAAVARAHFPYLPVNWFLLDRYNNTANLAEVDLPVAIVVAEQDQVVPARFGEALYRSYSGPKQLHSIPQADHNNLLDFVPQSTWLEALTFLRAKTYD